MTNEGLASIQLIDPTLADVIATIKVAGSPTSLAWDGANLWTTSLAGDMAHRVDPTGGP